MSTLSRETFLLALAPWFSTPTPDRVYCEHDPPSRRGDIADLFRCFVQDEVARLLDQPGHSGTDRDKLLEVVHAAFPPVQEKFSIWEEAKWAEEKLDEILRARVWDEVRRLKGDLNKSELTELVRERFSGKCLNDALWQVGSLFCTGDNGGC